MNTNKLKTRTMKNKLIVLVMVIMLLPLTGMAQKIYKAQNVSDDC